MNPNFFHEFYNQQLCFWQRYIMNKQFVKKIQENFDMYFVLDLVVGSEEQDIDNEWVMRFSCLDNSKAFMGNIFV